MLFKLAWRNIWRNKTRSIITISAIFVAVFLSNVLQSFQRGMWQKMLDTSISFTGHIQIKNNLFDASPILDNELILSKEILDDLKSIQHITSISQRIQTQGLVENDSLTRYSQIQCLNPEQEEAILRLASKLDTGNVLKDTDHGILIGKKMAHYFNCQVGDSLTISGKGFLEKKVKGKYAIRGLFNYGPDAINSRLIIFPLLLGTKHFGGSGSITALNVYLDDETKLEQVANAIRNKVNNKKYRIQTWKEMNPELDQAFQADSVGSLIFLGILFLIISFGIFGTILMMTAERIYEFGVLLSLGTRKKIIIVTLLLETSLLSLIGTLLGTAISYPIMYYFKSHEILISGDPEKEGMMAEFGMEPVITCSIHPDILFFSAGVILVITAVIALYPVLKILQLNPVKAMKR
jgi:putative ABC transport system permease protein